MAERDLLLSDVVKDVLGPRGGAVESFPPTMDPLNEYITGALAPLVDTVVPEIEHDDEFDADDGEGDEPDTEPPAAPPVPGTVSPSLDPRLRPRSIGISFMIQSPDSAPRIEVCATWARYHADSSGAWVRKPEYLILPPSPVDSLDVHSGTGVRLLARARRLPTGAWRVAVRLVNEMRAAQKAAVSDEYIFQPEIRILLVGQASLAPLDDEPGPTATTDEKALWLLYRHRPALARGYICGAVWKQIDPQRCPPPGITPSLEPPFHWIRRRSAPACRPRPVSDSDVRTEFVPTYPVFTPDMGWNPLYGRGPELDPDVLSDCWDPVLMRAPSNRSWTVTRPG